MASTETKQVTAWACGMCDRVYKTKLEASACCKCVLCKGKFRRTNGYASQCEGCSWGMEVRHVRASLRRETEQLASSKERLAKLLAHKPTKAATPTPGTT